MAKYKVKTKNHTLIVRAKLSFSEKLNERELDSFARKYIRGLLKAKVIRKNCIEYTGPIGISLDERMKKRINKYDFLFIIEQIVDITQKLNTNEMNINYVNFDIKNVFINETTKEIQFIYLPLKEVKKDADVIGFIENIIYSAIPTQEQDDYISKFTYFLKGLQGYCSNEIEKYILKEDKSIIFTIKKHNVGQSGFMTDKPEDYYNHYNKKDVKMGEVMEEEATGLLAKNEETGLLDEEEETALLNEEEETGILEESTYIHYPILYRVSTEEKIEISKPVFRIGKEHNYSDYFVANNDKVSRNHADIITRNGRYFVNDLNSRNRTFINGKIISAQQETEIFEGDCLKLANEEFVFHM